MKSQQSFDFTANPSAKGKQDSNIFDRLSQPKHSVDLTARMKKQMDLENSKMSLSVGRVKRRRQRNPDEDLEAQTTGLKITTLIDQIRQEALETSLKIKQSQSYVRIAGSLTTRNNPSHQIMIPTKQQMTPN